jgi:hypothetical protein
VKQQIEESIQTFLDLFFNSPLKTFEKLKKEISQNRLILHSDNEITIKKIANNVSPAMHEEVNRHVTDKANGLYTKEQQASEIFLISKIFSQILI